MQVQAAVHRLATLFLRAGHTYLSLGFYFDLKCGSAGRGLLLATTELAEEKHEGYERHLSCKTSTVATFFSRMRQSRVKMSAVKLRTPKKPPGPWGRTWPQALLDLQAPGSTPTDPQLCDFLDEEVKLIKKMYDYLTHLHRLASSQAGQLPGWSAPRRAWTNISSKGSPSSTARKPLEPRGLWGAPLHFPVSAFVCPSLSLKLDTFLTTLETVSLPLDQMETIKHFAAKTKWRKN